MWPCVKGPKLLVICLGSNDVFFSRFLVPETTGPPVWRMRGRDGDGRNAVLGADDV